VAVFAGLVSVRGMQGDAGRVGWRLSLGMRLVVPHAKSLWMSTVACGTRFSFLGKLPGFRAGLSDSAAMRLDRISRG
jgi:hypothetical protein